MNLRLDYGDAPAIDTWTWIPPCKRHELCTGATHSSPLFGYFLTLSLSCVSPQSDVRCCVSTILRSDAAAEGTSLSRSRRCVALLLPILFRRPPRPSEHHFDLITTMDDDTTCSPGSEPSLRHLSDLIKLKTSASLKGASRGVVVAASSQPGTPTQTPTAAADANGGSPTLASAQSAGRPRRAVPFIIGVTGGTASGKTVSCVLPHAPRLRHDWHDPPERRPSATTLLNGSTIRAS